LTELFNIKERVDGRKKSIMIWWKNKRDGKGEEKIRYETDKRNYFSHYF
jgi:hypothetical protein